MFYCILIDILACLIERFSLYIYLHFLVLSPGGMKKRRNQPSARSIFDIPISKKAPTRAVYTHIYKHLHILADMFVLSFTYSLFSSSSPSSFMFSCITTSNE